MSDQPITVFNLKSTSLRWAALGATLIAACCTAGVYYQSTHTVKATIAGEQFRVLERVQTGHQRAERVAFLQNGRYLAVTCPRYDQLVIYEIDSTTRRLKQVVDRKLKGKPVALAETPDGLLVLQRPAGDNRHIEPGFCEPLSIQGEPLGPAWPVGYDPDDLVLSKAGSVAFVLLSGNAEGESNRPDPELIAFDLTQGDRPLPLSKVRLGNSETDPQRIQLSAKGTHAAVLIRHGYLQGIDLSDPSNLRATGTVSLSGRNRPALSASEDDVMVMPAETMADVATLAATDANGEGAWETLVTMEADGGELVFFGTHSTAPLGKLTLRGPVGIGQVRLCGLAYSPERGLLAVADRSGGLHLIERSGPANPLLTRSTPVPVSNDGRRLADSGLR